jgi:hypothetical protein
MALTNMIIPPWVKPLVIVVAIAGALGGAYWKGRVDVQVKWDLAKAVTDKEIADLKVNQGKVTIQTITKWRDRVKTVEVKGDTITKYVDKYITKEADAKCVIPNNAVLIHDLAAKNKLPEEATPK